jgi:hypothetical protein
MKGHSKNSKGAHLKSRKSKEKCGRKSDKRVN